MSEQWRQPSWNQLHRMGQINLEQEAGIANAHYTVRAERVGAALDLDRLRLAWQRLLTARPVLRARFDLQAGAWSVPAPDSPAAAELDTTDADRFTSALVLPFDYAAGPIARLVVVSEQDQTLVGLAVEHLVSDGWTLSQLWDDLVRAYSAQEIASESRFVDYVAAQNAHLETPETQRRVEDYGATLIEAGGAIPALHLASVDSAASAVELHTRLRKAEMHYTVDGPTWQRVLDAARGRGMSGPNLLLAALHVALGELTHRTAVGSTLAVANRLKPIDRSAAGWYASKLLVPADTRGAAADPADYLSRWQQRLWLALDHSDIPWAYLLYRLNPADYGRFTQTPFASFNFQPWGMQARPSLRWEGARFTEPIAVQTGSRDATLATFWLERSDQVAVAWEHRSDLLPAGTVDELWQSFRAALDQLCEAGLSSAPASAG
ncbi:MAG TPA: condensation domain-containing protein [Jatrophihabitans sp.]|nr:condensation domain-containing protein [Jatrophihabitans sp.]